MRGKLKIENGKLKVGGAESGAEGLPQGWEHARLDCVAELIRGVTYGKPQSSSTPCKGYVPLLRANNFGDTIDLNDLVYVDSRCVSKEQFISSSDILISMSSGSKHLVGKSTIVKSPLQNSTVGGFCAIVRVRTALPEFIAFFLKSDTFKKCVSEASKGSNINNLKREHILGASLPLPPLPVQRKIISKIEELFSDLDAGVESLKKAQAQLKVYRQSVLKAAFEGKLTAEWRAQQKKLPTAQELLATIQAERQAHYETKIKEWKSATTQWEKGGKVGKKPSKPSAPEEMVPLTKDELKELPKLPEGWAWSRLLYCTHKIGDIDHKMPKVVDDGIPYVSTGDIDARGKIDFKKAKQVSIEDYNQLASKISPQRGDIIFPRYGTIGRNVLVETDQTFLISYSCAIIKTLSSSIYKDFLYRYTLSPIVRSEIRKYVVETTQANIGIASIGKFVFPVCSFNEQQKIVSEVNIRLQALDDVENQIVDSLARSSSLRQSILKRAFEGKLV